MRQESKLLDKYSSVVNPLIKYIFDIEKNNLTGVFKIKNTMLIRKYKNGISHGGAGNHTIDGCTNIGFNLNNKIYGELLSYDEEPYYS